MHHNNRTARRCLAAFLILALLLGSLPAVALAADPAAKPEEKCTAELRKAMDEAEETDRIPVVIRRADLPAGYLDGLIADECGDPPPEDAKQRDKDLYLRKTQDLSFREYAAYNNAFIKASFPDCTIFDILYASGFTPTIWARLTKAEIEAAASDDSVISMDLYLYEQSGADVPQQPEEKYSEDLRKTLSERSDTDLISVFIHRRASLMDHLTESAIGGAGIWASDWYDYNSNLFRSLRREFAEEYHSVCTHNNEAFRSKRLPDLERDRIVYSGQYSSVLVALLTKAEIASAAADDSVLDIALYLDGNAVTTEHEENKTEITDRFPDDAFRAEVYKVISKNPGDPIYNTDVAHVYSLKFYNREIKSLEGIAYFSNLHELTFIGNVAELDLRTIPMLRYLNCSGCDLQSLQLPGDLEGLYCYRNNLTELSLSTPALKFVLCDQNQLERLDLTGCLSLMKVYCEWNNLSSLDLTTCPYVRELNCSRNYLKEPADIVGYHEWQFLEDLFQPEPEDTLRVSDGFTFYPQKDEAIWPRLEKEIKARICRDYGESQSDPAPAGVIVEQYYGCHSGWQVVLMGADGQQKSKDPLDLKIGGFVFKLTNPADRSAFLCWKDGQLVTVEDAYARGLITNADLYAIFLVFYRSNYSLPFTDVNQNSWYYEAIRYVWNCDLFNGVSSYRFAPDGVMNRAMLVTVLWRQNGEPAAGGSPFTDVADGRWYTDAVAWAAEAGIVNGVGRGRFAPDSPLTREQLVTILYRMSGAGGDAPAIDSATFPDAGRISAWAAPAMAWAVENGIIEGMARIDARGNRQLWLEPGTYVTRAQAATILLRIARSDPEPVPAQ